MGASLVQHMPRIKVGTYTGDGNATQAITGVGFQPDFVIIMPGAAYNVHGKTGDMGLNSKRFDNAWQTNRIVSLDADGFTVGNNDGLNVLDQTNYYVAFKR